MCVGVRVSDCVCVCVCMYTLHSTFQGQFLFSLFVCLGRFHIKNKISMKYFNCASILFLFHFASALKRCLACADADADAAAAFVDAIISVDCCICCCC